MVTLNFIDGTGCTTNNGISSQTTPFLREENKKSSFAISTAVLLTVQPIETPQDDSGCAGCKCLSSAYITCSSSEKDALKQIFLFGGFELIANVNSLQVFVTRDGNKGEEYLTSCKGVRARDLPQLESIGHTSHIADVNATDWYKFVLASPGGAKPVHCVRLEFSVTAVGDEQAPFVVVRTIKAKCRLTDSESDQPLHQNAHNLSRIPPMHHSAAGNMGSMNSIAHMMAMIQNGSATSMSTLQRDNQSQTTAPETMNNLASMMAMMGDVNSNTAAALPTSPMVQQTMQESQPIDPLLQQYQQKNYMNHAEMMSSIAGLGMYLRSSEEKTMKSLETMLSQMEARLSQKLDALSSRLDVIEHHATSQNSMKRNGSSTDSENNANEFQQKILEEST